MLRNIGLLLLACFVLLILYYLYPGSKDMLPKKASFEIIAQRGVHHAYPRDDIDHDTCTASIIYKPTHDYIENTIESIGAAFDYGATIVEIDVRPTKDHQLVVFHNDDVSCRTDGSGYVWDSTLAQLRLLDLGYGYTYDGGKTYPYRGKAVGKISTLTEVLQAFPGKRFLVDNKNLNDSSAVDLILELLTSMLVSERERIYLRMPDKAFASVKQILPDVKRLIEPRGNQKKFFKENIYSFGLWELKGDYADKGYAVPAFVKKYLVGWPYRFLNRAYDAGARMYIFVHSKEELDAISDIPFDGIVTYNIEQLGLNTAD